jgi:predicted transcriptional regulator
MSLDISFTPEIEAKLRDLAVAAGKDVHVFVREAIEEKLALSMPASKTGSEWSAAFDVWMREVAARAPAYPPGFVVDDSRETTYEGRGE